MEKNKAGVPQQLTGWAVDPLNPQAALPIEIEIQANGSTKVAKPTLTRQASGVTTARGYPDGKQGFTGPIPAALRSTPVTEWAVYALDTLPNPAVRTQLPELRDNWTGVSGKGIDFLKNYEGFVGYPYDDPDGSRPRKRVTTYPKDEATRKRITIDYGHVIKGEKEWQALYKTRGAINITVQDAEAILRKDLKKHEANVRAHVKVPLSQCEFDALTLLSFNIGKGKIGVHDKGFAGSSVARYLDNDSRGAAPDKAYDSVEEAWQAWHHVTVKQCKMVNGKEACEEVLVDSEGLLKRRRDETRIFNNCEDGDYPRTP